MHDVVWCIVSARKPVTAVHGTQSHTKGVLLKLAQATNATCTRGTVKETYAVLRHARSQTKRKITRRT